MRSSKCNARVPQLKLVAFAVASCFSSAAALANPTGPGIVNGSVSINSTIPNQLLITNSPNSIINWQGFSIAPGEITQFLQQSAASAVLNRVVSSNPSDILGSLLSNGRVFLINPNGIVFGAGATIDVAGLVASTLGMTNDDFLAGRKRFQETPGTTAGTVENLATFSMLSGGPVYLIGRSVTNGGVITNSQGEVVLAAGEQVELMEGATPGLSVLVSAPGDRALNLSDVYAGRVGIYGGLVEQSGFVSANSASMGADGSIQLQATNATRFTAGSNTFASGNIDIATADLTVAGNVYSGPQHVNATGAIVVQNTPGSFAQIGASGGQTINAGFVEVSTVGGGSASIANFGGDQMIATSAMNAAGEGVAVRSDGGGYAGIFSSEGGQRIDVRNADRVTLDSVSGQAHVVNIDGVQSLSLTGTGANALELGASGGPGQSVVGGGGFQTVLAGAFGERGSITITGPNSGMPSNPVFGGTQTISTSGALTILGGAAGGPGSGISANGIDGQQTIHAQSILLQGSSSGSGGSAVIEANNGSQTINAGAGGITLLGGAAGANNFVQINQRSIDSSATQTVKSAGPVLVEGGSGDFNFALIRAFGGQQDLTFGKTTVLAGAGGIDNFSAIQGRSQDMTVHGDLDIVARGSAGSPTIGGGARIGGTGGASPSSTNLRLTVDGDLTMTGGDFSGTGVLLGNTTILTGNTDISVNAGGNVTLNGGSVPDTYALIGSRAGNVAGGDIGITAGGTIALNSTAPDQASLIRTTDGVELTAQQITEGSDARIEAGSLATRTAQGTMLGGANSVNELAMLNSASGNVAFNNTSALLTVTGISQVPSGALSLYQAGNLRINGDVTSGAQSLSATGDMTVTPGVGPNVTVHAYGPQIFNVGGSFSLLGGTAWNGYAQTLAKGPVRITTGDDLNVRGGGGLLAYALLYGSDDLHLTVGDELHVDRGRGLLAFARVQTSLWDRIFLDFPNRSSGGYYVDGREGVSSRGLDGLFAGFLPARRGRSLIVSYGE